MNDSNQEKGDKFVKFVNEQIEEAGLGKAVATPGSGSGKKKGDSFNPLDFLLECKNEKQWRWESVDQAKRQAQQGNYYKDKWALIVRDPRYPEFHEVYAVISFWELLILLKKNKEPIIKEPDRAAYYDLKNLENSIKKVLKHFKPC